MPDEFNTKGFVLFRNFLSIDEYQEIYDLFDKQHEKFAVDGTKYLSVYSHPILVSSLCEKLFLVQEIIGEKVLPTYSYGRKYKTSQLLPKHTDRNSCEVSVTMNISGDDWPIFIEDLEGNSHSVILKPRDGLVYQGIRLPHWREKLESTNEYWQVFLHYVKKNGMNSHLFFDTFRLREKIAQQKFSPKKID